MIVLFCFVLQYVTKVVDESCFEVVKHDGYVLKYVIEKTSKMFFIIEI